MFMLIMAIVCFIFGYMLLAITSLYPTLRMVGMDYIATILFIIPTALCFYRMSVSKTWIQTDKIPTWKQLINYLRRDNEVVPMVGKRAYTGESFLDVPELGLVEFLGKDTVYQWGDKKVCWGLENVNFTPDPRYFNLTALLYELGFKDSDDVREVLLGQNLYLMGKIYQKMLEWDDNHGAKKLVKDMENYDGDTVEFKPVEEKKSLKDIKGKIGNLRVKRAHAK